MRKTVVLGLTESVTLYDEQGAIHLLEARIDTGATLSSIDETLAKELGLGPIIREKVVKSASGTTKRPVVKVHLELLDQTIETEVSLADRSHMKYPILIGQNILRLGCFIIDPCKYKGVEQ